jgi:general stress protein YciG
VGKKRGFAAMDPELQKKISASGGKAAHAAGKAHEWTVETAEKAGQKGGRATQERLRKLREKAGE